MGASEKVNCVGRGSACGLWRGRIGGPAIGLIADNVAE